MSTVGVNVFLRLSDMLAKPLRDSEKRVDASAKRMQDRLKLSLKLKAGGAAAAGIAYGAQRLVTGFTDSIREVEKAKGELASLGVRDLDAVVQRGREMQMQLAGVTADAFVRASYDIKSGISSLSDQGVADMTASAMLVAKATKGQAEQMTSLFATSYGIFKKQMSDLTDSEFGEQFGASLAASVQMFKTDGAKMQQAIQSAGAGAVNIGMEMSEQLALLGMMQQQMEAGEAGTALKAFASNAARAHEAFGKMAVTADRPVKVRILDENGQLRAMPDIFTDLRARYGETLDAFEAAEIKDAFGTEEAQKLINALYGQEEAIRANVSALDEAASEGEAFTRNMAALVDNNWDSTAKLMGQRIDVIKQMVGQRFLPVVQSIMPHLDRIIDATFAWIDAHPELVTKIGWAVVGLGAFAAVIAPVLIGAGMLTSTWALLSHGAIRLGVAALRLGGGLLSLGKWAVWLLNPLNLVKAGLFALRLAVISTGIGALVVGLAMAGVWVYNNWSGLLTFFQNFGAAMRNALGPAAPLFNRLVGYIKKLWGWVSWLVKPLEATSEQWAAWGTAAGTAVGNALSAVSDFVSGIIDWFANIPNVNWADHIGSIDWRKLAGGVFSLAVLVSPILWTAKLLGGAIKWKELLGRFSLSGLIKPITWTLSLLGGAISWVGFLGKFALSSLITPIKWTLGLLGGAIRWISLLGNFALKSLITPIKWTLSLLGGAIQWTGLLGKFALSGLITPMKWTISLLGGAIQWVSLLGKFALKGLVTPITWGASLIPKISWINLAGGGSKFALKGLLTAVKWTTRLIPVIGWAALAGELLWHLLIKKIDWATFINPLAWKTYIVSLPWSEIINPINWAIWFNFVWSDILPAWDWGFISEIDLAGLIKWPEPPDWWKRLMGSDEEPEQPAPPSVADQAGFSELPAEQQSAAETVERIATTGPLPTASHITQVREEITRIQTEITAAEDKIASFGNGPQAPALALPVQAELNTLKADLLAAQTDLENARARSGELTDALAVLSDTQASPTIDTASVDAALAKVAQLSNAMRTLPGASAGGATPGPVQARARGGRYGPGWLLTGEQGPELRYENEGGFIAHNRQLNNMLGMAQRARDTIGDIPGLPQMAEVALAGAPAQPRGTSVQYAPQNTVQVSLGGGLSMEEVRSAIADALTASEERAQVELRRLMHD
jgi:TP901 family phage tail tape measure protein